MEKKEDEESRVNPAPLPVDRAFVVQLRAPALAGEEVFAGRAEHIASGAVSRFASADSLIEFIKKVLVAEGSAAAEDGDTSPDKKKS